MTSDIATTARSINQAIEQIYSDIQNSEVESAVLMGENLLIEAYSLWNKALASASSAPDVAFTLAAVANAYSDTLNAVGNPSDAYGITLGAITNIVNIESTAGDTPQFNHAMMQLYLATWHNLARILSSATPTQHPQATGHIQTITRYIGSMLYHYYYAVGRLTPDNPLLTPVYQTLREISSFVTIDTTTISVADQPISPTSSLPLIHDLVARSQALSLINL